MTDDTIGVIASNLTIAHFSRYDRKPFPTPKPHSTGNEIEMMEDAERFAVTRTYKKFKAEIERDQRSESESDT